jgi:hypothetical protein
MMLTSSLWLRDMQAAMGVSAEPFEAVGSEPAVVVVIRFILRALGAYDIGGPLDAPRSCILAGAA